jgi:hypothetical protein|tara:strand:- start:291 stop:401 length:111 start_codon:yes stop_codon:yes gene_type:complete
MESANMQTKVNTTQACLDDGENNLNAKKIEFLFSGD